MDQAQAEAAADALLAEARAARKPRRRAPWRPFTAGERRAMVLAELLGTSAGTLALAAPALRSRVRYGASPPGRSRRRSASRCTA